MLIFQYDAQGFYLLSIDADPMGPLPSMSTTKAPPATEGTEVAQWTGSDWAVLPEMPPPPPPPPAPVASRDIHPVALYERFTFAERVGITRAGTINPADPAEKQTLAATVNRFEKDLSVYKRPINLDGEGLSKGLALLYSIKVLEPDWQARIVQAPISDDERRYGQF